MLDTFNDQFNKNNKNPLVFGSDLAINLLSCSKGPSLWCSIGGYSWQNAGQRTSNEGSLQGMYIKNSSWNSKYILCNMYTLMP